MQTPTPNQTIEATLVLTSRIVLERKQTCVAFLIEGFFSAVFLFILERNLVILQIPVIAAFFLLYYPPSYAKELLLQQKLGLAITGACIVKSVFLIINMIIYLIHYFKDNNNLQITYPTVSNQVFVPYLPDTYLFPQLAPNNVPGLSTFLGAILAILFGLMTVFELVSIYSAVWMIKKTRRLIEKIQYIQIPQTPENAGNNNIDEANDSANQIREQQVGQEQQETVSAPPENNA